MQFLKILLMILVAAAVLTAVLYAASVLLKKRKMKQLKNTKLSRRKRIHEEMCLELYKRNVFSGFSFPEAYSDDDVVLKYTRIDCLAVTRGGIAVITFKDYNGKINNRTDTWMCEENENGEVLCFNDPLEETELKRIAILHLIERGELPNVPVYSMVVFTGRDVTFSVEHDNLTTYDEFTELIKQLNSNKALSLSEMFEIRNMLNDEKRTKVQVAEHIEKIFG